MRPLGAIAAIAIALLVYVQPVLSDTSLLGSLLHAKVDAANCGTLGRPCCIHKGPNSRCRARLKLECYSDGSNPRCVPCGGENQIACRGRKCNRGLTVTDRGMLYCTLGVKPLPPKNFTKTAAGALASAVDMAAMDTAAAGGAGRRRRGKGAADDRRDEQARGRKVGMSACDTQDDCLPPGAAAGGRGPRSCIAGVCVPCGGPGQACCLRAPLCDQYGAGSVAVTCDYEPRVGTNVCRYQEPEVK